jgi:hypothetical protein
VVTFADLVDAQHKLGADPMFNAGFPLLLDFHNAEDIRLTLDELHAVIDSSPLLVHTKRALVVSRLGSYGVGRAYATVRGDRTASRSARVVKTIDEAAEWLGVELEPSTR